MGFAGPAEVTPADVVAIGRLKVYGRSGCLTLLKLADGRMVRVTVSKLPKDARKWVEKASTGCANPNFGHLAGGFTAVLWKSLTGGPA